jgi:hypothetical protein
LNGSLLPPKPPPFGVATTRMWAAGMSSAFASAQVVRRLGTRGDDQLAVAILERDGLGDEAAQGPLVAVALLDNGGPEFRRQRFDLEMRARALDVVESGGGAQDGIAAAVAAPQPAGRRRQ